MDEVKLRRAIEAFRELWDGYHPSLDNAEAIHSALDFILVEIEVALNESTG